MEPAGDPSQGGYWVRICRSCGAIDPEGLPFPDQSPPTGVDSSPRASSPHELPRWRCHSCGGDGFRSDNWHEGGKKPPA